MHRKDVEMILLAVAIEPVARKHALSAAELVRHLRELRPGMDLRTIERAAALADPTVRHPC